MKVLIAYYSFTGNTAKLAHSFELYLKSERHSVCVEDIELVKEYSSVVTRLALGGSHAILKMTPPIMPLRYDPAKFDCIAVLSPTWAWTYVPPVATYLSRLPNARKGQLAIPGSTGSSTVAAKHIARVLRKKKYEIVGELGISSYPKLPSDKELREKFTSLKL